MKKAGWIMFMAVLGCAGFSVGPADAAMTRTSAEKLMRSGKSMKCGVDMMESGTRQTGTIYLSRDRMRGDFEIDEPGEGRFHAHMVQDGDWVYSWGGPMGEAQGVKTRVDRSAGAAGSSDAFDSSQEMDMDCEEWPEDGSKFGVPSNVQFMEMGGMAGGMPGAAGGGMQAMQCQACDQVPPGPERDMCKQMMGC